MVLFIMLYKVVLTFVSVDEILKCASLESYRAALSCGVVYYAVQDPLDEILKCDHSNESSTSCGAVYYAAQCGSTCTFESVDEILKCDRSNERY